ncbi:MAG: hypothetical protein ACQERB_13995 [Promethearchaeati archaeon]
MNRIAKFIDFEKKQKVFYNNLYLNDEKIVVKIPIHLNTNGHNGNGVKLDKFDLTKYTYLMSYD